MVLGERGRLRTWSRITVAVSSELIILACLRTIDRAPIRLGLDDEAVADRRAAVLEGIEGFSLVPLGRAVLDLASEPFPTLLGSLDAIHLATALLVRDRFDDLSLPTHDHELAMAARAEGLRVHGSPTEL